MAVRDFIVQSLASAIDPKVAEALLASYESLMSRFRKGDLDGALSVAGKFVEHTLRALEFLRTGAAPNEIKSPQQTVKEIEKAQNLPEGLRVLIPRIAHSMIYDVRSKRGALHVKEIDPRRIDAALSAQAASWILAEFIRQYHVSDEVAVEQAMEILMRPHIAHVEQFGDEHAVTKQVPCETEVLLLLARAAPHGLDRTGLGKSCKYPPSTVTGSVKRLATARHVHKTRDGQFHITGPGEVHLARLLDQASALAAK